MNADRLHECEWPRLAAPFDHALRDAVRFVFSESDPVCIIATGTVVRGKAHRNSDLDVYVVHDAPFRRRVQRFFNDVPTEIFINPPSAIRGYFVEEHRDGRELTAHMLVTGFVVFGSSNVVRELISEAEIWLNLTVKMSAADLTSARYAIATRFEDALDVVDEDPTTATMLLAGAVTAMLEFFCKSTSGRIPRGKDLLAAVMKINPAVGRQAIAFFAAPTVAERIEHATWLADRIVGARGFFEWDSGPGPVPPSAASD